jgi:hypothetical protein
MATAEIIQWLLAQQRSATAALIGGSATFYSPGTTTKKAVYTDRTAGTQASNPQTLDATGTCKVYGSGIYRIVVKDASGNTVYDVDNYSANYVSGDYAADLATAVTDATAAAAASATAAHDSADDAAASAGAVSPPFTHTIWVPAGAMTAQTTTGAAAGTAELATNKQMIKTLDFDQSTVEYAQFVVDMPKSWSDTTTFVAQPVWSHAATTTNFKVSWGIQAYCYQDDIGLDQTWGTAQTSNDTGGTTNDLYRAPATSGITPGGTMATTEDNYVQFRVYRVASDTTNDTLAIDARLHGIKIKYIVDVATDA